MVVLGLVLLVVVALLGAAVVLSNPAVLDLNLFGAHVPATLGGVFFTGAGAMLVALLGLVLIQRGIVRARRRHKVQKSRAAATPVAASSTHGDRPVAAQPAPTQSASSPVSSSPVSSSHVSSTQSSSGRRPAPESSSTTPEERAAMLADADQLTRDDLR